MHAIYRSEYPNTFGPLTAPARPPSGQTLNEIVLEALIREAGLSAELIQRRSLTGLAGEWVEDPEFDKAINDQDSVDPRIWK